MAGAVMSKIWNLFGIDTGADEKEEYEETDEYMNNYDSDYIEDDTEVEEEKRIFGIGRKSKVINMPQSQVRMRICKPTNFDQSAEEISNLLIEKHSVIVNLEYVNKDVARRIIDFVSGSAHALNGHMEKISNWISWLLLK